MFTRQLTRAIARPAVYSRLAPGRTSALGMRGYAEASKADTKPKLAFRFNFKDIPTELLPLGVVVGACVIGAGAALVRIVMLDPDMLHHRSVGSGALEKGFKPPPAKDH